MPNLRDDCSLVECTSASGTGASGSAEGGSSGSAGQGGSGGEGGSAGQGRLLWKGQGTNLFITAAGAYQGEVGVTNSIASVENVLYFVLSVWFFQYMYRRSRQTGQFARNEE